MADDMVEQNRGVQTGLEESQAVTTVSVVIPEVQKNGNALKKNGHFSSDRLPEQPLTDLDFKLYGKLLESNCFVSEEDANRITDGLRKAYDVGGRQDKQRISTAIEGLCDAFMPMSEEPIQH
jgi:hypothetical protein